MPVYDLNTRQGRADWCETMPDSEARHSLYKRIKREYGQQAADQMREDWNEQVNGRVA